MVSAPRASPADRGITTLSQSPSPIALGSPESSPNRADLVSRLIFHRDSAVRRLTFSDSRESVCTVEGSLDATFRKSLSRSSLSPPDDRSQSHCQSSSEPVATPSLRLSREPLHSAEREARNSMDATVPRHLIQTRLARGVETEQMWPGSVSLSSPLHSPCPESCSMLACSAWGRILGCEVTERRAWLAPGSEGPGERAAQIDAVSSRGGACLAQSDGNDAMMDPCDLSVHEQTAWLQHRQSHWPEVRMAQTSQTGRSSIRQLQHSGSGQPPCRPLCEQSYAVYSPRQAARTVRQLEATLALIVKRLVELKANGKLSRSAYGSFS